MQKFPDRWTLLAVEKNSSILENSVKNLKIISELSVKDVSQHRCVAGRRKPLQNEVNQ
jgi:hypothetical protein